MPKDRRETVISIAKLRHYEDAGKKINQVVNYLLQHRAHRPNSQIVDMGCGIKLLASIFVPD